MIHYIGSDIHTRDKTKKLIRFRLVPLERTTEMLDCTSFTFYYIVIGNPFLQIELTWPIVNCYKSKLS